MTHGEPHNPAAYVACVDPRVVTRARDRALNRTFRTPEQAPEFTDIVSWSGTVFSIIMVVAPCPGFNGSCWRVFGSALNGTDRNSAPIPLARLRGSQRRALKRVLMAFLGDMGMGLGKVDGIRLTKDVVAITRPLNSKELVQRMRALGSVGSAEG